MAQFIINLAKFALHVAVKALIFAIPVAFVAQWLDVPSTWKMAAFVMFCIVWSGIVDGGSSSQPEQPSAAGKQKAAAVLLTPAQVAAEAQKLTPRPLRSA